MKCLIDTHLLIWTAAGEDARVPRHVRRRMDETACFVSAVSGYEIAQKYRLGKLPEAGPLVRDFERWVRELGFGLLPLMPADAVRAGLYGSEHRDPFDRFLAAQAEGGAMVLLSNDEKLDGFGVRRIW